MEILIFLALILILAAVLSPTTVKAFLMLALYAVCGIIAVILAVIGLIYNPLILLPVAAFSGVFFLVHHIISNEDKTYKKD